MIVLQFMGYSYLMNRDEKVSNGGYIFFTIGMFLGQIAVGINSYLAFPPQWSTVIVQVFFFGATLYGALKKFKVFPKIKNALNEMIWTFKNS